MQNLRTMEIDLMSALALDRHDDDVLRRSPEYALDRGRVEAVAVAAREFHGFSAEIVHDFIDVLMMELSFLATEIIEVMLDSKMDDLLASRILSTIRASCTPDYLTW